MNQEKPKVYSEAMCRFLKVSQSAYYAWLQHKQTEAEQDDAALQAIFE